MTELCPGTCKGVVLKLKGATARELTGNASTTECEMASKETRDAGSLSNSMRS